jgi:hypothetical protein
MSAKKAYALKCPGCGAAIGVNKKDDLFACAYCGASIKVERAEGKVSLHMLADTMVRVAHGVDHTAAELAIVRLSKDIDRLQTELNEHEEMIFELETKNDEVRNCSSSPSVGALVIRQILYGIAKGVLIGGLLVISTVLFFSLKFAAGAVVAWMILIAISALGHVVGPDQVLRRDVVRLEASLAKMDRDQLPSNTELITLGQERVEEIRLQLTELTVELKAARAVVS